MVSAVVSAVVSSRGLRRVAAEPGLCPVSLPPTAVSLQRRRAEMPGLTTQPKTGTCREVSGRVGSLTGRLGEPSISGFRRHVSWILSPSLYFSLFSFGKN